MDELAGGIRRVTLPLPTRPGHVHAYLLPGDDGWTLVDTGLGLPDAKERWAAELDGAARPVHADRRHALPPRPRRRRARPRGADRRARRPGTARLRPVRARLGRRRLGRACSSTGSVGTASPTDVTRELIEQGSVYRPFVRYQPDPRAPRSGRPRRRVGVVAAPGHADGQLMLLRDGVLVAADHLLGRSRRRSVSGRGAAPTRSATTSRRSRRRSRSTPRSRCPVTAIRSTIPSGARASSSRTIAERLDATAAALGPRAADRLRRLVPALRRRPQALGAPIRRRRDALRTSSGSCCEGGAAPARGRRQRHLYFGA